jgi:hypothetical protein
MQKRAKKSNTFTDKTDAECEVAKLRKEKECTPRQVN